MIVQVRCYGIELGGGISYDWPRTILIDSWDNIYITGITSIDAWAMNYDIFLVKFDSSGTQLWNQTWGGTEIEQSCGIIDVPTLVIHGMKDIFVRPMVLEALPEYVKNLKIIKAENSSHWVMHDDPDLVISSIKEFLS